jgi:hypothetical protein
MRYEIAQVKDVKCYFLPGKYNRCFAFFPFGIALYETTDMETYTHRGVVGTIRKANQWLSGKTPRGIIKID